MEIIINKPEPKYVFKDLAYGETFIDEDFGAETVLMRISKNQIDCNLDFEEPYYGAAINLKDGTIYGYGSDEPVVPVFCTLRVSPK